MSLTLERVDGDTSIQDDLTRIRNENYSAIEDAVNNKAESSDVYTQTETDNLLATKQDKAITIDEEATTVESAIQDLFTLLQGGSTGQMLVKTGDSDYDFEWKTPFNVTDFVMEFSIASDDLTLTIPCQDVGTFDAIIQWGDGSASSVTSYDDSNLYHEYAEAGTYFVKISGTFPNIYFNNTGDKDKLIKVVNFGDTGLITLEKAFFGCSNLINIESEYVDISNVTNAFATFHSCSSLFYCDSSNWDTSNISTMNQMFYDCSSLSVLDISNWDTSNVTDMNRMFRYCSNIANFQSQYLDISSLSLTNSLEFFAQSVTIATSDYDATLITWEAQASGIPAQRPDFGFSKYSSAGAVARQNLIDNYGWTITDGGLA